MKSFRSYEMTVKFYREINIDFMKDRCVLSKKHFICNYVTSVIISILENILTMQLSLMRQEHIIYLGSISTLRFQRIFASSHILNISKLLEELGFGVTKLFNFCVFQQKFEFGLFKIKHISLLIQHFTNELDMYKYKTSLKYIL